MWTARQAFKAPTRPGSRTSASTGSAVDSAAARSAANFMGRRGEGRAGSRSTRRSPQRSRLGHQRSALPRRVRHAVARSARSAGKTARRFLVGSVPTPQSDGSGRLPNAHGGEIPSEVVRQGVASFGRTKSGIVFRRAAGTVRKAVRRRDSSRRMRPALAIGIERRRCSRDRSVSSEAFRSEWWAAALM